MEGVALISYESIQNINTNIIFQILHLYYFNCVSFFLTSKNNKTYQTFELYGHAEYT